MESPHRQSDLGARTTALKPAGAVALLRGFAPFLVTLALALLLQIFIRPLLPDFHAKLLLDIGTNVILAVSLTMVNGFTGQFSMGHAAFMAVGAYVAAGLVYYGSARMLATEDFADAEQHSGILGTMLVDRELDIADGKVDSTAEFLLGEEVMLRPGARYALRLDSDEGEGVTIPLWVVKNAHVEGERIGFTTAAPIDWVGSDARIVLKPSWFTRGDALFVVSCLAGGIAAAICGYLVGLPSLRLKGDYLAIVTLGFGEIVRVIIQSQTTDTLYDVAEINKTPVWQLPKYLGGSVGFSGLPFYSSLFWAWLFAGITLLVAFRMKRATFGRAFLSIREDEIAAEAMGINTTRYKVWAFVIAAFFAGIAGSIYAHTVGVQLNAGELNFVKSFDIIIMVVLGGLGSISGSALAAFILTILPEALRQPPSFLSIWGLIPVAIAILLVLFAQRRMFALLALLGACVAWEAIRYLAMRNNINLSEYRMVLFAIGLIMMMILRPQGLLGLKEVWEIRLPDRSLPRKRKGAK